MRNTLSRIGIVIAVALLVALAACQQAVEPKPPEPQTPVAVGTISAATLTVGAAPTSIDVAGYFNDPDDQTLTYSAQSSDHAVATASAVGSTVTVTAVAQGSATITVTATDEDNLSAIQTFNVTVNPASPPEPTEQAPVAVGTIGSRTLTVGATPTSIDVAGYFNDPDGQTLTYSARSSDLAITTTAAVGSTVTVTAVAPGTATITVTATDEDNLSASQTFNVTVVVGATAPRWIDTGGATRNWTANTAIPAFTVPAVDEGSPAPTYSASGLPSGLSFATSTRRISGTPSSTGSGTITITATNSAGSDTYTIPYTVVAAAVAPSWIDTGGAARNWTANTAIPAFTVPAVDEGSPAPTYSASGLPSGLSFATSTRRISGTPSSTGSGTITITATNSAGSDTYTIPYTVVAAAVAPSWTDTGGAARNWTANTAIPAFTVPAVDEGSPAPTYSASGLPAGISFNSTTRRISGTPDTVGSGTITITATNSVGSDTYAIPYTVAAAPTPRPTLPFTKVLNPNGRALTNELYTLPLGTSSAEVFVISTNTTTRLVNPNIERLDSGRRAEQISLPRPDVSQPVPEPVWLRDLQELPSPRLGGATDRKQQLAQAQSSVAVGDRDVFIEWRDSVPYRVPATARKVIRAGTTTLAVWVADREWGATCAAVGQCLTQEMVDAISTRFLRPGANNDIYDWVTAIFGAPWGPHGYSDLIPPAAADQIHILLFDRNGDGAGTSVGYFSTLHSYLRDPAHPDFRYSAARLIFFIDSPTLSEPDGPTWDITDHGPSEILDTLAHEFQHMIHYYQKLIVHGLPDTPTIEAWLNEMASEVTTDLIADKLRIHGPRGVAFDDPTAGAAMNTRGRLPLYNASNFRQVTAWYNDLKDYSITYALGAYLARTYGAGLFREIVQNEYAGVAAIEAALVSEGHGVSFGDVLTDWAIANLLSDDTRAPHPYRYNSGTWFTSAVGGQTVRLGSINLFNYRYWEPGHPLHGWEGPWVWPLTTFNTLSAQLPHSNLYVNIGRTSGTVQLRINAPAGNRITVVVKE